MRIAMVHNYYQVGGGEDESFRSEARLLQGAGHDVFTYTEHNGRVESLGLLRTAARTSWSGEAYKSVRSLLQENRCDVLHVQNFFPLASPSVYYAAHAAGVPVVQTLRNYRLLCCNATFFRDGRVCEDCLPKRALPWPGVAHACYRGSRPASASVVAMMSTHRALRTWGEKVDIYVALTEFARGKFLEGGFPPGKVVVKPNFVHPDPGVGAHEGRFALFVGRLTQDKGVTTLLEAWRALGNRAESLSPVLRVVGDGPLAGMVREAATDTPGVEYMGRLGTQEVYALMRDATFLVLPSEWYETFGRVAVEAVASGAPVVASNIGAVAEVVEDGVTGLRFVLGDPADLARKLEWAFDHPGELTCLGCAARREYEAKYTAERNYGLLMNIYGLALERHSKVSP